MSESSMATQRTEPRFFVVFAVPRHADDFELVGIFSKKSDADAFFEEKLKSKMFLGGCTQALDMPEIIDLLVRDRLRELAEPIAKLAMTIQGEK
jgi:hypothetical protein